MGPFKCVSEIINFLKLLLVVVNLDIYLFMEFLAVLPTLSCTHGITFAGRFECIGCIACDLPKSVSHPPLLSLLVEKFLL